MLYIDPVPYLAEMDTPPGISIAVQARWPAHESQNSRNHDQHNTRLTGLGGHRRLYANISNHPPFTIVKDPII